MKAWRNHQANLNLQSGQSDKALAACSRAWRLDYPRDANLQSQFVQNLANAGDYEAAYAWLNRMLGPDSKWDAGKEATLRNLYAGYLQQQSRYRELAVYLADSIKRNPELDQPYSQYVTALIRSNQANQAETLVGQWLREGQVTGELPPAVAARLTAAIAFALGQGYDLSYTDHVEERWQAPLARASACILLATMNISPRRTLFSRIGDSDRLTRREQHERLWPAS